MVALHSEDGRHFLGLRQTVSGSFEIVYEGGVFGKRFVWRIKSDISDAEDLERQLFHAIRQKQVLEELCQGLRREEIDFEMEIRSNR
jgi:hypothetical protein